MHARMHTHTHTHTHNVCVCVCVCVCVTLKDRKRSLGGKTTTTRCGIRETAITRNVMLWLFSNNHNALWHLKMRKSCRGC